MLHEAGPHGDAGMTAKFKHSSYNSMQFKHPKHPKKTFPFWMMIGNCSQILIQNQKILVCSEDMDERYKPSIFGMRTYVSSSDNMTITNSPNHLLLHRVTDFETCRLHDTSSADDREEREHHSTCDNTAISLH